MVLGGDFRQILPVVIRGGRPQVVGASLGLANFWSRVTKLRLRANMRVQRVLDQAGQAGAQPIAQVVSCPEPPALLAVPCGRALTLLPARRTVRLLLA